MTEIYSSEPNLKKLVIAVQGVDKTPVDGSVVGTVTGTNDKQTYGTPTALVFDQLDNGRYEYAIPQQAIEGYRYADVDISYELPVYGKFNFRKTYNVVRRLINFDEFNEIIEDYPIEYKIFSEIEINVRSIIEAHCNQEFNCWEGTQKIRGTDGVLFLSDHLDRLDKVGIRSSFMTETDVILDSPGYEIQGSGFAIENEAKKKTITFFHSTPRTTTFDITGLWGWGAVPTPVRQAAIELLRSFLCEDIEYRRRYIDNIRAGDVRIQFNPGAYQHSTGNPIADSMLAPYVRLQFGAV